MKPNEQYDEAAIFEEVLSATSQEDVNRTLDRRCGNNTALRARIQALLKSYHQGEYLERFAVNVFDDRLVGAQVGEYTVMELIGQGGMGDVYAARRIQQPDEIVALKVIKPGMDTRQVVARFNLERNALSQFNHPHIAKYIDSGIDITGRFYFAMELVQGVSIVDYCDHHRLPVEDRLRLFLDVCSAVSHAHSMGIIHRDLKPQNVLVAQRDGKAIVKVIDFGVAKALSGENEIHSRLTGALQWIGTPRYVSPEQLTWSSDVDARADVFSLGVLIYELLTGSTPSNFDETKDFDLAKLRHELLQETYDYCSQRIAACKPDDSSQLAANRATDTPRLIGFLRGDIDRIADKALEHNRDQRYPTVDQLADDIKAHLAGRSISLRPQSTWQRWQRWQHRHPKLAARAMSAGVGIAVLALAFIAIWEIRRATEVRESVSKTLEHAAFVQNIQSASQFVFSGDTASAKQSLQEYLEDDQNPYADHFAARLLQGMFIDASQTLTGHNDNILDMDITENRRWIASGDKGGDIILWDRQTSKEVRRVHPSDTEVTRVRFRPHGNLLVTTGQDAIIRMWDATSLESVGTLEKHRRTINGLAWSPDGKLLATGDREGFVYIWDVDKQTCVQELPKQLDTVRCAVWSPDGGYLAMAVKEVGVQLWETRGWTKVSEFSASEASGALAIAFSLDSQHMVFGGYGRTVSFIGMKSLTLDYEISTQRNIWSMKFGRNSELFVGEAYGVIQLFQRSLTLDSWIPTRLTDVGSPTSKQRAICLDEDAQLILTASEEQKAINAFPIPQVVGYEATVIPNACIGTVSEWGLQLRGDPESTLTIQDQDGRTQSLNIRASSLCVPAYSKARQQIAIAGIDGGVDLVSTESFQAVAHIDTSIPLASLSFSASGERLSIAMMDGSVEVWDLRSMTKWTKAHFDAGFQSLGVFSPIESIYITGQDGRNTIFAMNETTGKVIGQAELSSELFQLRFHPKGDYFVAGEMGWLSVWAKDVSSQLWRAPLSKNSTPGVVDCLCFAPEGDCLAVLLRDGTLEFWDMESRVRLLALQTPALTDNSKKFRRWMCFHDPSTLWLSSEDGRKIFQIQAAKK